MPTEPWGGRAAGKGCTLALGTERHPVRPETATSLRWRGSIRSPEGELSQRLGQGMGREARSRAQQGVSGRSRQSSPVRNHGNPDTDTKRGQRGEQGALGDAESGTCEGPRAGQGF